MNLNEEYDKLTYVQKDVVDRLFNILKTHYVHEYEETSGGGDGSIQLTVCFKKKQPRYTYVWVAEWENGTTTSLRAEKNPWPTEKNLVNPVRIEKVFPRQTKD